MPDLILKNAPIGSSARKMVSCFFQWRMPPRESIDRRRASSSGLHRLSDLPTHRSQGRKVMLRVSLVLSIWEKSLVTAP